MTLEAFEAQPRAPRVRPATPDDAPAIAAIYNRALDARIATFETRHRTPAEITRWFDDGEIAMVSLDAAGTLAGYATTSRYRARECYAGVREFSVYVRADCTRRGHGTALLAALIARAEAAGMWKLVARIFPENAASLALCRSLGFREVGVYRRHAKLDGAWRDTVIVEKLIGIGAEP